MAKNQGKPLNSKNISLVKKVVDKTQFIRPFNLHPEKWFEGYPVKSTLFFSGWQKHLRFSRAWHPFFFWFTLWNPAFSHVASHPEKNRVDFTGYPSNHFPGCRLNGRICEYIFDFLKKCVPITEIPEIMFPFQDFSTVFDSNLKIEAKTPRKNFFSIYDRVIASGSNRVALKG